MANTSPVASLPLVESGLAAEALISAIATRYMEAMHAKRPHHAETVQDYHLNFARAVVEKAFYEIEFITNGLNAVGKMVFSEVTGVRLPKAQGASRSALMAWAGVDPKQDELREARRLQKVWYDSAARQISNMADIARQVEDRYERGYVQLVKVERQWFQLNRAGNHGFNWSQRGCRGDVLRPFVEAFLRVQQLRVELGEIQEPEWVDPQPAAPAAAPTPPQTYSPQEQTSFGF